MGENFSYIHQEWGVMISPPDLFCPFSLESLWLVGVRCKHQSHIVLGGWMLGKYSGQNVMQASMYNLQSLLCFMFHCCVQLERRADFPDDEVDVLFREFEDSSGQGSPLSPLLGGTSGSRLVSVVSVF